MTVARTEARSRGSVRFQVANGDGAEECLWRCNWRECMIKTVKSGRKQTKVWWESSGSVEAYALRVLPGDGEVQGACDSAVT